ncbi:MAG: hypothetical protein HY778_00595 [Betaproteobacteria bacterium]|nr:hypothetical protein [Betaproteobacteria bacterium]
MRMRILTAACLGLASTVALAAGLEAQTPIDWPPKAVPKQPTGKVPDLKAKNEVCMDCHAEILDVKAARKAAGKDIPNLHRLHLDSKKVAYEGKNRDCLTCHEMIVPVEGKAPRKEGWFAKGDVYHPNWLQEPKGVWKKLIVRAGEGGDFVRVDAVRPMEPHLYKPSLKRLVCAECHGSDSKIKTFYGVPEAGK